MGSAWGKEYRGVLQNRGILVWKMVDGVIPEVIVDEGVIPSVRS